jgi:hypothetical protein
MKPRLVRIDGGGTDYDNSRLKLLWQLIKYKIPEEHWKINEIEDFKGDLLITWDYLPEKDAKEIIDSLWNYLNEYNTKHQLIQLIQI